MALPLLPLAYSGVKAGIGALQAVKGRKTLRDNQRPEYQIPNEIKQNLTDAQLQEIEGLPAAQRNAYIQNIDRGMAAGLAAGSDRNAGLAGLGSMVSASNDAFTNLLSMDAQARQQNRQNLAMQRQNMAQYKDQAFDINKMQPYIENQVSGDSMLGSGLTNMMDAFQTSAAMAHESGAGEGGLMKGLFNRNKKLNGTMNPSASYWGNPDTLQKTLGYYNG